MPLLLHNKQLLYMSSVLLAAVTMLYFICLFPDVKSIVQTHTLCTTQIDIVTVPIKINDFRY